jgi:hypothetical protein
MPGKEKDSKEPGKSSKDRQVKPAAPPVAPATPDVTTPPLAAGTPGQETRAKRGAPLTPDQLADLLQIIPASDSIELKVTVSESNVRSTVAALQMDPLDAQIRQVFFFDTPDLALDRAGVVVRARRIQGKGGDSVVKLRPVVPQELPEELRASPAFVVEVDAMPGGFVCSGTLKNRVDPQQIREAVNGRFPVRKLFTAQQRALVAEHGPEGITLDDLSVLGPIFVLKLPSFPQGLKQRLVAEMWLYPDGSRILELSTKCLPSEIISVLAESRRFLDEQGIDRSGDQQAKTKRALTFFSKEIKAAQGDQAEAVPAD